MTGCLDETSSGALGGDEVTQADGASDDIEIAPARDVTGSRDTDPRTRPDVRPDGALGDGAASPPHDGSSGTDSVIPGLWLIGWPGGLDHFDWFRFGAIEDGGILWWGAPTGEGSLIPFTGCVGTTRWRWVEPPHTIRFELPAECADLGVMDNPVTFTFSVDADKQPWPEPALLTGKVSTADPNWSNLTAYKYSDDWCDAELTACSYPFP